MPEPRDGPDDAPSARQAGAQASGPAAASGPVEESGYFASGEGHAYAFLCRPARTGTSATSAGRQAGVVVLGPLAEEKKSSLRALVEICRALASAGMAAMRIDFRGTGDSPGCSEDVSLKSAVEDAVAAGREIKDACGCARVALVGLRFGAAAAVLAAGPAGADALVLVEPVVSGDAYVREMERQRSIRRMMTAGAVSAEKPARRDAAGGDAAEGATPADAFDLDGLALSGAFVESLRAMDLLAGARELRANNPAPALVLQVGARGAPRGELAALARELGARAEAIVAEPFWLRTEYVDPAPAVAAVVEFLRRELPG